MARGNVPSNRRGGVRAADEAVSDKGSQLVRRGPIMAGLHCRRGRRCDRLLLACGVLAPRSAELAALGQAVLGVAAAWSALLAYVGLLMR